MVSLNWSYRQQPIIMRRASKKAGCRASFFSIEGPQWESYRAVSNSFRQLKSVTALLLLSHNFWTTFCFLENAEHILNIFFRLTKTKSLTRLQLIKTKVQSTSLLMIFHNQSLVLQLSKHNVDNCFRQKYLELFGDIMNLQSIQDRLKQKYTLGIKIWKVLRFGKKLEKKSENLKKKKIEKPRQKSHRQHLGSH